MPLTYPKEGGQHLHLWLTKTVEDYPNAEIKALCGGVHVFGAKDDLVTIKEKAGSFDLTSDGEYDGLVDFLDKGPVCPPCGDILRERLGLEERDLTNVPGVGSMKAEALREAGFETPGDLRAATQKEIAQKGTGIGNALAARIKAHVGSPPGERR